MLSNKSVQTMWVLLERGEPLSPAGGKLQHCILWQKKLKMEWKINIRKGISLKASFTQNFFALIHCLRRHSRLMAILTRERQRKREWVRGRERERERERERKLPVQISSSPSKARNTSKIRYLRFCRVQKIILTRSFIQFFQLKH